MKRIAIALAFCLGFLSSAMAAYQGGTTFPSHVGPVATNGRYGQLYGGTPNKSVMSRTDHIASQKLTSIQLIFEQFSSYGEANNGSSTTITAAIEYPAGTFTQVKFSGSASGTIPAANYLTSDAVTVNIPFGQRFWVRSLYNNATGLSITNQNDATNGDGANYSTTVNSQTDLTVTAGTIPANGIGIPPLAIIGTTTLPSVCLFGDSRMAGLTDTPSSNLPDTGDIARSVGAAGLPYIDMGWSGEKTTDLISGHTARAAIANAYCTHVINDMGVNDFAAGTSAATVQTNNTTIAGYFTKGQKLAITTISPVTSSTDSYATVANQTTNSTVNGPRVTYNNTLRTSGLSGWPTVFDVSLFIESSYNSGLWLPYYTGDGTHAVTLGAAAVRDNIDVGGWINPTNDPIASITLSQHSSSARALSRQTGPLLPFQLPSVVCVTNNTCNITATWTFSAAETFNGAVTVNQNLIMAPYSSGNGAIIFEYDQNQGGSYSLLYRVGTAWQMYDSTTGKTIKLVSGGVQLPIYTIAALPACAAANEGLEAYVSDTVQSGAVSPAYHAAVASGGSQTVHSRVICSGSGGWLYN